VGPAFEGDTESALDHDVLSATAERFFRPIDSWYRGGPASFLIYNSMICRLPQTSKRFLSSVLFRWSAPTNHLSGKFLFPYFIARSQRRNSSVAPDLAFE
jgi:hypothetical protein